jgi:rubrerythrin
LGRRETRTSLDTTLGERKETAMEIYRTGDKPGEGTYRCTVCGRRVVLHDDEALPECFSCKASTWTKVK